MLYCTVIRRVALSRAGKLLSCLLHVRLVELGEVRKEKEEKLPDTALLSKKQRKHRKEQVGDVMKCSRDARATYHAYVCAAKAHVPRTGIELDGLEYRRTNYTMTEGCSSCLCLTLGPLLLNEYCHCS